MTLHSSPSYPGPLLSTSVATSLTTLWIRQTLHSGLLRLGLLLCLLLFFASANANAAETEIDTAPHNHSDKTLLVLGDSLSAAYNMDIQQGWVHLLKKNQDMNPAKFKAINASIGGETSAGGLKRLPQLLKDHQPSLVIIELGGNDGLRGYPIKKLKANLQAMVDLSREANAQVIILGMQIPPNYGKRYSQMFYKSFQDIAATNNVALIEFFLEGVALNPELMQADGIHPNEKAQPILAERVAKKVAEKMAETVAEIKKQSQ